MYKKALLATLVFFIFNSNLYAKNCSEPNYRAFDFWLGSWQVTTELDNIIRKSKISLINDGCTLLEEYSTPSGYIGKSLNIFDKQQGLWHQTWTDNTGVLLLLTGNIKNGSMVLTGTSFDQENNKILNKITWTANADGTVRQHWQSKKSKANQWQTLFDGLYTKRK